MSLHFFNYSVVDSVEANQPLNTSLSELVEKGQHTAVNFIRLMEKFPLPSNNAGTEHAQVEQQKIYSALCQARVKLVTLYGEVCTQKPSFLQNKETSGDDDRGAVHLSK
jgi:hypothetical protein